MVSSNNYIGQYQTKKDMGRSFDAFWQKNGVESKDGAVKNVVQAIFNLLDDDIRNSIYDNDRNQVIFDRMEFQDLMAVITKVLGNYLDVEQSDTKYTTDVVRKRIQDTIQNEILKCLGNKSTSNNEGQSRNDVKSISDQVNAVLDKFFDSISEQKQKRAKAGKLDSLEKVVTKFTQKLNNQTATNDNAQKLYNKLSKSAEFSSFVKKCRVAFGLVTSRPHNPLTSLKEHRGTRFRFANIATAPVHLVSRVYNSVSQSAMRVISGGLKRVTKAISGLKSTIVGFMHATFSCVSGCLQRVVSSIFGVLRGAVNVVLHPIRTIGNIVKKSNWLVNFLVSAFSNPLNAFVLGFFVHFAVAWFNDKVMPYVNRYIMVPATTILGVIDQFIDEHGGIRGLFTTLVDSAITLAKFIRGLFKPYPGVKKSEGFATLMLNLFEMSNAGIDPKAILWLLVNGERLIDGLKKTSQSTFLSGMFLAMPPIFRLGAAYFAGGGAQIGSKLEEGKYKNGNGEVDALTLSDNTETNPDFIRYNKISQSINKNFKGSMANRLDILQWSRGMVMGVSAEDSILGELETTLKNPRSEVSDDLIYSVLHSDLVVEGEDFTSTLKDVFSNFDYGDMGSMTYMEKFRSLHPSQQKEILLQYVEMRRQRLEQVKKLIDGEQVDAKDILNLKLLWNVENMGIQTFSTNPNEGVFDYGAITGEYSGFDFRKVLLQDTNLAGQGKMRIFVPNTNLWEGTPSGGNMMRISPKVDYMFSHGDEKVVEFKDFTQRDDVKLTFGPNETDITAIMDKSGARYLGPTPQTVSFPKTRKNVRAELFYDAHPKKSGWKTQKIGEERFREEVKNSRYELEQSFMGKLAKNDLFTKLYNLDSQQGSYSFVEQFGIKATDYSSESLEKLLKQMTADIEQRTKGNAERTKEMKETLDQVVRELRNQISHLRYMQKMESEIDVLAGEDK